MAGYVDKREGSTGGIAEGREKAEKLIPGRRIIGTAQGQGVYRRGSCTLVLLRLPYAGAEYVKLHLYIEGTLDIMSHRQCGVGRVRPLHQQRSTLCMYFIDTVLPTAPTRALLLVIL